MDALAGVPMFAKLDRARLTRLALHAQVRRVRAGETVALAGEPATHLIVVETGTLVASRVTVDGRRLEIGEHRGPCAVDKSAVLDGRGHTATWTAATESRIRLIPAADFHSLLGEVPSVRQHVLRHLAGQLYDRQERPAEAHYADATSRVAAWLLAAGRERVVLPRTKQGLAELIGASRVTVNRALRRLSRDGLIRVDGGAIVVLDADRLARTA